MPPSVHRVNTTVLSAYNQFITSPGTLIHQQAYETVFEPSTTQAFVDYRNGWRLFGCSLMRQTRHI